MAKAVPYIAAAGTFLFTGSFQAAQAAFVVSSAVMGLVNKPKTPAQASQERQASAISLSFGEVPREVLLGHTITGGSLVDGFNHGGQYGTDYVTLCIALADHPTGDPLAYWIGENRFLFTGNGNQGSHGAALALEFRQATQGGHIPPAIALANGWTIDDRLCSIGHIWVTYRTDEKVWTQGHPQFRFELNGLRVYDPRRDVRFGYTGPSPQTWEDTSTHLHTQNAALLRYALARGVYAVGHQGDPAYLLVGRGLSEEEAPPLYTISAANLCDEKVDGEDRYLAQGTIRASDTFIAVEEMFATAMGGTIIQRGGAVEVEPGQPKAAVATITDLDLVAGAPVSYSGFLPDTDGGRANSVLPRYISPLHRWQDHAGPVRRDVADIISDGGPREITLSMPLVAWEGQAGRVAEMMRRLSRLERRMTLMLPPDYAWIEEGDWLAVQSDRRHGGATRRYRVEAWTLDRAWRMQVTLREISATVYGGVDLIADQADPPPPPVVLDALALAGVSIEAASLTGADGTAVPGVKFSWDAPVDRAMREVRAEVRPVAAPSEVSSTTTAGVGSDLTSGRVVWPVTNGVRPDAALEARLVPIGENGRPALATPWTAITAPGLKAGDVIPTAPSLVAIDDRIDDAFGELAGVQVDLDNAADLIATQGVEIAAARGGQPNLGARITQVVNAQETGDQTNADLISLVEARRRVGAADAAFRLDSVGSILMTGDMAPEAAPAINPAQIVATGPLYGWSNPGVASSVLTRNWIPHAAGIVLEVEIEVETVANPSAHDLGGLAMGVRYYNAAGVGQGQSNFFFPAPAVGQRSRVKRRFANPAPAGGSAISTWDFYRGRFIMNRNADGSTATGADVRIIGASIRDVTAEALAEASVLNLASALVTEQDVRASQFDQVQARLSRAPLANVPFDNLGTGYFASSTSTNTSQVAGAPEAVAGITLALLNWIMADRNPPPLTVQIMRLAALLGRNGPVKFAAMHMPPASADDLPPVDEPKGRRRWRLTVLSGAFALIAAVVVFLAASSWAAT